LFGTFTVSSLITFSAATLAFKVAISISFEVGVDGVSSLKTSIKVSLATS